MRIATWNRSPRLLPGIVTTGTLQGCSRPGIDHIAISYEFTASNVKGWPNDVTGNRLSDHDGAICELAWLR